MNKEINDRFSTLIEKGNSIFQKAGYYQGSLEYWMGKDATADAMAWISSASNLINFVTNQKGAISESLQTVLTDKNFTEDSSIPVHTIQKILGLLSSCQSELEAGLLRKIQYIIFAEAFDDFLDHADKFHKSGKKTEAAILASAVLEDTIKKIAKKNEIDTKGHSLEELITQLTDQNVFTPVKGKRIKGLCATRNHAFHAEWDEFDIRDVGELIKALKTLIEDNL